MNRFDLDPKAPKQNFAGSSYDTYTLNWKAGNLILLEAGIHLLWLFCIASQARLAGHYLMDIANHRRKTGQRGLTLSKPKCIQAMGNILLYERQKIKGGIFSIDSSLSTAYSFVTF